MAEELPVLIAVVTAQRARELDESARAGRDAWVPLEREPTRGGRHLLEVYTADSEQPMRFLAEPTGHRSEHGSGLRLRPYPPAPPPSQRSAIVGGRFEILSRIGKGSIGAVYKARQTGLNRIVAVKVLHDAFQQDAEFCQRFYAEALAMSRLNHANLINIQDFGQEPGGLLYIAMPYVEGRTLREVHVRDGRLDVPRIVGWMLQVCAGLGHAHGRGLIHRDVKPDNLMVVTKDDDDGQQVETIMVLDFGFAVPPTVSGDVAQRLAGTPVYMSPEQTRGEELDARSDVYACGIMMYELALASGSVPFLSNDVMALRQMHQSAPVPLIAKQRPDIDPRYDRIVQRALAKRREDRYASMMELRADLKNLLLPESVPEIQMPPPPPSSRAQPASTPKPKPVAAPEEDWLERGTSYNIESQNSSRALADKLAKDASVPLGELSRERNPRAFLQRVSELEAAVRILAERADAKTLGRISAVVAGLAEHRDEAGKNALAAVARLFTNPELLAPIATSLIVRGAGGEPAVELLKQARISGAIALYGARAKVAADARGRVAFVTTMKVLGSSARPVLRAALERFFEQPPTMELVEDVLLSVPKGEDEAAGELIVRFAGSNIPSVARAAARALPRVVGARARSVLLQLLHHQDDGVCIAAIVGLHELDAIDLDAVARLSALVDAGRVRTQQLQGAFITALQSATASAHAEAMAVLARLRR